MSISIFIGEMVLRYAKKWLFLYKKKQIKYIEDRENADGIMYYYMKFGENKDIQLCLRKKVGEKHQKLVNTEN